MKIEKGGAAVARNADLAVGEPNQENSFSLINYSKPGLSNMKQQTQHGYSTILTMPVLQSFGNGPLCDTQVIIPQRIPMYKRMYMGGSKQATLQMYVLLVWVQCLEYVCVCNMAITCKLELAAKSNKTWAWNMLLPAQLSCPLHLFIQHFFLAYNLVWKKNIIFLLVPFHALGSKLNRHMIIMHFLHSSRSCSPTDPSHSPVASSQQSRK